MRKIKAGKRGSVTKYISRSKAIKKLQLSLKDFRRLCILKGVYPREPPKKLKQTNRTFYHLKDINFLALDPLIDRIRAQKVYHKRYRHAKDKGQIGSIRYLVTHKPKLSLVHLVRQRYPDFLDALRDLDDPLSLLALFTIFPTHKQFGLSSDKIQACRILLRHFELYIIHAGSLRKTFASIKGIYYQAQIFGQKITYIVPYKYPPNLPNTVDYRVMSTFLDFYLVLIKFVNYKLYTSTGLVYPPLQTKPQTYSGYTLQPLKPQQQQQIDKYQIDQQFLQHKSSSPRLFGNLHFYLSSQVPRYSLQYIILSFGGNVNLQSNDITITHVITDRDGLTFDKTKQYVQPQWVYDCVNFDKLLTTKQYAPNKTLPPHLSPFVEENYIERHVPEREKELRGITIDSDKVAMNEQLNKGGKKKDQDQDMYDIVAQKKRKLAQQKIHKNQMSQIAKNIISNKNRKLLRNINKGLTKKAQAKMKLQDKSKQIDPQSQSQ